jgi:hypothetical protein
LHTFSALPSIIIEKTYAVPITSLHLKVLPKPEILVK